MAITLFGYVFSPAEFVIIILFLVFFITFRISLAGINRRLKYFNNAFDEYLKYLFSKGNGNNNGNY